MTLDQQEEQTKQEIQEIIDVLIKTLKTTDAILCYPVFGSTLFYSTALYQVPEKYCISVDLRKFATDLYAYGYRLTKGDAIKDEQEIDAHSSDT